MNATTLASRAVIAAYAQTALRPVVIAGAIILSIGLIGSAYLMTLSGWWILLMIVVIAYGIFGSIIWLITQFVIGRIKPEQTLSQRQAVKQFVDRLSSLQDTMGMTKFGLLLSIIRDVSRWSEQNTITGFIDDSKELTADFSKVVMAFERSNVN